MSEIPYNDRIPVDIQPAAQIAAQTQQADEQVSKLPQPEISIIVDGNQLIKPGMKSVFIEDDEDEVIITSDTTTLTGGGYCSCNTVNVCTCNTVCTCEGVCTCEAVCSCVGHCSCNQVCSCDNHCSCDTVCTCNSQCTCQSVGGGTYCSCVPVH
ncbi:MAG: hypothetical protein LBR83_03885 [Clostridiales bacterium]|nr:hypothetical protein [Clostridiales bacterium]